MFKLRCSQLAKEQLPHQLASQDHKHQGLQQKICWLPWKGWNQHLEVYNGHAGVWLGDVDDTGVELLPLNPSVGQHKGGQTHRGCRQHLWPHILSERPDKIFPLVFYITVSSIFYCYSLWFTIFELPVFSLEPSGSLLILCQEMRGLSFLRCFFKQWWHDEVFLSFKDRVRMWLLNARKLRPGLMLRKLIFIQALPLSP